MSDLEKKIERAINSVSAENASNTPDYILAQYLVACLAAFNTATQQRETWYGRDARSSFSTIPAPESPTKEQPGEQKLGQGWVPVSERLPEPSDNEVLVYVPNAKFNKVDMDCWQMQHESPVSFSPATIPVGVMWGNHDFEEVTHWMPLPSPPERP